MSIKGGYKIIDMTGLNFGSDPDESKTANKTGIYEELEGNYDKAILIHGLQLPGLGVQADFFTQIEKIGSIFGINVFSSYSSGTIGFFQFRITDDDAIIRSAYKSVLTAVPYASVGIYGTVKQAESVPALEDTAEVTADDYNAIITSLINAGIMEDESEE